MMEKIATLGIHDGWLELKTDAGSVLIILDGGIILKQGFEDASGPVLKNFSHRLYLRNGVLYHELNDHSGSRQQIPVAVAEDTPLMKTWLSRADKFIP